MLLEPPEKVYICVKCWAPWSLGQPKCPHCDCTGCWSLDKPKAAKDA